MENPMAEPVKDPIPNSAAAVQRTRNWDGVAAIIAALVGLLALCVSGYTAYIQRQQVRAQVWPYMTMAYQDPSHKLTVFNKGVGPAIVRSVQVLVDGKPQSNWIHVFAAIGMASVDFGHSTLNGNVLSPGETLPILVFPDESAESHFREAMNARGKIHICYCSTLGECWMFTDRQRSSEPTVQPIADCKQLPPANTMND